MALSTSSIPVSARRELSPVAALLLTIGGNIVVVAIATLAVLGVGAAAVAVFGGAVLDAL